MSNSPLTSISPARAPYAIILTSSLGVLLLTLASVVRHVGSGRVIEALTLLPFAVLSARIAYVSACKERSHQFAAAAGVPQSISILAAVALLVFDRLTAGNPFRFVISISHGICPSSHGLEFAALFDPCFLIGTMSLLALTSVGFAALALSFLRGRYAWAPGEYARLRRELYVVAVCSLIGLIYL